LFCVEGIARLPLVRGNESMSVADHCKASFLREGAFDAVPFAVTK
jgi:hypothetical protein